MRTTLTLSAVALLIGLSSFIAGGQIPAKKSAPPAGVQPAVKSGDQISDDQKVKSAEKAPSEPQVTPERLADEEAIRQADEAFVKAYGAGDAKAIAALFTPDAEYVDESGNVFQGRDAIEESLVEFFAENPDCQLEMTIDSIRFVNPGIAIEDGSTILTHPELPDTIESRYTTMYVKTDGKWLAASVRDHAPKDRRQHRLQLEQLDWLLGDWVDEAEDSVVTFS
ncbi:MAG TPA: SgcJ/EcaC family oxidoreductase, partial [Planctomycetaceae bacterium]|nr:SgcJ/EcaC family oxidoreductase [Planctomycetaceae bacterium]